MPAAISWLTCNVCVWLWSLLWCKLLWWSCCLLWWLWWLLVSHSLNLLLLCLHCSGWFHLLLNLVFRLGKYSHLGRHRFLISWVAWITMLSESHIRQEAIAPLRRTFRILGLHLIHSYWLLVCVASRGAGCRPKVSPSQSVLVQGTSLCVSATSGKTLSSTPYRCLSGRRPYWVACWSMPRPATGLPTHQSLALTAPTGPWWHHQVQLVRNHRRRRHFRVPTDPSPTPWSCLSGHQHYLRDHDRRRPFEDVKYAIVGKR